GQEHDQAIDADALAGSRRQTVLERADVVLVHLVRFEIARGARRQLRLEPPALLGRIVELAEGIRNLEAANIELEPLDGVWIVWLLLRERRDLGWKVVDERRLNQGVLVQALEHLGRDRAGAPARLNIDVQTPCERGGRIFSAQI